MSTEKTFIHFDFTNGSRPYIFWGTPSECNRELKRWEKHYYIRQIAPKFYRLTEE